MDCRVECFVQLSNPSLSGQVGHQTLPHQHNIARGYPLYNQLKGDWLSFMIANSKLAAFSSVSIKHQFCNFVTMLHIISRMLVLGIFWCPDPLYKDIPYTLGLSVQVLSMFGAFCFSDLRDVKIVFSTRAAQEESWILIFDVSCFKVSYFKVIV